MGRSWPRTDWRDADAYAPLLDADRSLFAWEWLRRDAAYCAEAVTALSDPHRDLAARPWGLHRFEDPSLASPAARPVWRADRHPYVLAAMARVSRGGDDAFHLSRLSAIATMVHGTSGAQHWLLSDGLHTIRLDISGASASAGPIELTYRLTGRTSAAGPLLTLRRLLAFAEQGRFSKQLHRRETRARRWILTLRAHDAINAGASQREIAAALLSDAAANPRWRLDAASVRSQVQRVTRAARSLADDGYRAFLR